MSSLFGTEAALVFNCGYHANTGILPAVCDTKTLILADKLIHASLIDGIRLSDAKCIRYRHNEYSQLERLVETYHKEYEQVIIVTESIFSMDGDEADLPRLVKLKRKYPNVLLYLDEAHAVGVRGNRRTGMCRSIRMHIGYRLFGGHFRKGTGFLWGIYRVQAGDTGLSDK